VLVGVAAFAGVSSASSGASGYRTAEVSTEEVEQTLAGVGTIEPVDQAAVAFPVSGTVATVDVAVGATVVPGQVLATLDPTQLEASLHESEATLAQAELTLEKVLSGEATSTTSGSSSGPSGSSASSGSAPSGASSSSSSGSSSTSSVDQAALTAARQAVAAAQHTLDGDLAAAEAALDAATIACATSGSTSTSTSSTSTTSTTTGAAGSQTCQDALAASLAAQQAVAADVAALNQAISTLDGLVTAGSSGSGSSSGSTGSSGTSGSSSSGSSTTVSSSDIVAAQKAVDAAAADVAVAQQAVAQGTIVSPIAGTVTSIGLEAGESVSAGSSTSVIRVVGQGGYQVTTSVAVTDLPHVAVGQSATVVADGTTTELTGTVVQIGLVANSASGSSTTYPVVIALTDPELDLPDGGLASVRIVTAATSAVTAVPTSAVTTTDTGHTVVVLKGGSPETIDVEVGTIGSTWTEITGGLEVGDTVVLADLSQALPGSATSSSGSTSTGPNGGGAGSFTPGAGGSFQPPSGGQGGPPGS
jgi:HlyD family secretion protein